ncbi:MAG: methyltransferase domain-containing protein [Dehalococcoidales bacterium]|nr:methyltransferase domain-containing protein [Dehalococcoidales bacterium]
MNVSINSISAEAFRGEVRKYYTEIERYDWVTDTKYPEKLFHNMRAEKVASIVNSICRNSSKTVLDIGCGTGLITRRIKASNIVALDMNQWALERARLHTDNNVTFVPGDAENLPLPSASYDIVICTEVLEHLIYPERALGEISRVLKPGASFIGSVPTKSLIWKYRKYLSRSCPITEPFHNNYTIQEFRPLLKDFDIIDLRYCVFGLTLLFQVQKRTGNA